MNVNGCASPRATLNIGAILTKTGRHGRQLWSYGFMQVMYEEKRKKKPGGGSVFWSFTDISFLYTNQGAKSLILFDPKSLGMLFKKRMLDSVFQGFLALWILKTNCYSSTLLWNPSSIIPSSTEQGREIITKSPWCEIRTERDQSSVIIRQNRLDLGKLIAFITNQIRVWSWEIKPNPMNSFPPPLPSSQT